MVVAMSFDDFGNRINTHAASVYFNGVNRRISTLPFGTRMATPPGNVESLTHRAIWRRRTWWR